MWEPKGKLVDSDSLGPLEPVEVLYEFGCEFLTYVARDRNDAPLLVHSLSVFNRTSRYVVSAVDSRILGELKAGRMDIYSALQQPRCWIADVVGDNSAHPPWRIHALHRVDFDAIPIDYLPRPGVMLTPDVQLLAHERPDN